MAMNFPIFCMGKFFHENNATIITNKLVTRLYVKRQWCNNAEFLPAHPRRWRIPLSGSACFGLGSKVNSLIQQVNTEPHHIIRHI